MDHYFDLGGHTRKITTSSPEAQTWFDRGLNWIYAFHREEALRCFAKVVELDPECAMGHWGLAHVTGPYYNGPWPRMPPMQRTDALAKANAAIRAAERCVDGVSPVEQALVLAMVRRFPEGENEDMDLFASWDDDYADAMREVFARFGRDDEDVCALTVEALICRTPWLLWDLERRVPADGADTAEALEILDAAVAAATADGRPQHPGLLHFKIHIMEMSPAPEDALAASDMLRTMCPDAAHLVHMPSHIYVQCGEYEKSFLSNVDAVVADDKYVALHPELGIYTMYRLHNIHFQIYSAMFLGQYQKAIDAADSIWDTVTPDSLRHDNTFLVNYLEGFYGMKVHVLIRFGRWQEIIDSAMPDEPDLFVTTTALWHYAKGVAYSATGDVGNAEKQQQLFLDAWQRVPEERIVFNNSCRDILAVGEAMLSGELEYRRTNYDAAFSELRRCVALYDGLNYSEPWVWMQPPRHALGALLLEQDRLEEAAAVYRADLGIDDTLVRPSQHPGNVWSLHGYLECCEKLGWRAEADQVRAELAAAEAGVDIDVTSSCFCRVDTC